MIQAYNLQTEYLVNPLGIDLEKPRLFWKATDTQTAGRVAYKINGTPQEVLSHAGGSMRVEFPQKLSSRDRVEWRIQLADASGTFGAWSDWSFFEMGLLDSSDWSADWICGDYAHSEKKEVRYPVDCFCKTFHAPKSVQKARLYITACGLYETAFNGMKIGDRVLAPGSTSFQKRVNYQTYDITELLCEGKNIWTIELADGFYASKTGCFNHTKVFGYEPKVCAQLELTDADGAVTVIRTDESFRWSNDGPIRYADMKDGEDIDFHCVPSYSGKAKRTTYDGQRTADDNVPIMEKERFLNPRILKCPDGNTVLDFGQNIAGYVEFGIKGNDGDQCSMVLGEKLDENGNFTTKNISLKGEYDKDRIQTIRITCDGEMHRYKTKFSVMGFQYALLLDWPDDIRAENFTSIAVYSDMQETFCFTSSDRGINRLVENTYWSVKGNFLDVPTDCPTRERAGWTGDAQLFFRTGNYMMDQRSFFRKWFRDIADCQKADGKIYNINPGNPNASDIVEWFSVEGGVGWGDAYLMIPYYFWKRYGDDSLMREHWDGMKKCFAFYEKRVGRRNIFSLFLPRKGEHTRYLCACGRDFGEWTEPADCAPGVMHLMFPHPEEGTAYLAYDASIMAEMAEHVGERAESRRLDLLAQKIKAAYAAYFLDDPDSKNAKEQTRMCKYVRPCGLGIAQGEERQKLLKKIVRLNRDRNYKIGTGFLSTPFILELLTEAGASDDAYRTLTNPEFGWMQQIQEGATTIWENWTNDASLNHYSKGACCQWLFDCVCGIRLDERENHFEIRPHVVSQMRETELTYRSVYGDVTSGYRQTNGKIIYHIVVPSNCTATVQFEGSEEMELAAGEYFREYKSEK